MRQLSIPRTYAGGRWWSDTHVAFVASRWRSAIVDLAGTETTLAAVLPTTHEGVALFAALATRRPPMVLLPPSSSVWPAAHASFAGMPILLPRSMAGVAAAARLRGFVPVVLDDADTGGHADPVVHAESRGVVIFTSGSTGNAKPVVRSLERNCAAAAARAEALGLERGDGCVIGVPLSTGQGLTMLLMAMQFGGAFGLLASVDHRAALTAIAHPEFACWWATPHFADVLGRCALTVPPVAPRVCLVSSPIPQAVFDTFRARFGVPLRQAYSSSESGPISVDAGPDDEVQHACAGRPLEGVEVRVGERPTAPAPPGEVGRVWVRSRYAMLGYGVPPQTEAPDTEDGWWATRDLALIDAQGRLWLRGRMDDCIRTRDGRLVNLAEVEAHLRDIAGVRAVAVVPLEGTAGATFGAVIERWDGSVSEGTMLPLEGLPDWARLPKLTVVASLPRLSNGKVDRRLCAAMLNGAVPA